MAHNGLCMDGVGLAAKIMENLHIDFDKQPPSSATATTTGKDRLGDDGGRLSSTQPVTPATDMHFEWERPRQHFASQPTEIRQEYDSQTLWASVAEDPTMSQFAPHRRLSPSLVFFYPSARACSALANANFSFCRHRTLAASKISALLSA